MYTFDKYQLRRTSEADREDLAAAIAADDDHRGVVPPDFFIKGQDAECLALELDGEPQFYFRQERALRIHIQFRASATKEERERNMEALKNGFEWLIERARESGYREIIFESKFAPLIRFCERRFGFKRSGNELICPIPPRVASQPGEGN